MSDCNEHTHIYRFNGCTVVVGYLDVRASEQSKGRRRCFQLLRDFDFRLQFRGGHLSVTAPEGYVTDYASVPIFLTLILGGRDAKGVAEAAVLHDVLCDIHLERFLTNAIMRVALTAYGVPRWKILAYFYGLMFVGYSSPPYRFANWLWSKLRGSK